MARASKPLSIRWFFLFAGLFALQVVPRFWTDSITVDEPMKITCSYYYWAEGDVLSNVHQAPLASALQGLPLMLLNLKKNPFPSPDSANRAFAFLFMTNLDRLQTIVVASRLLSMLLGLGIGFMLFNFTRHLSPVLSLFTLSLWAFEPNLLAFSGNSVSDIQVTFFTLAAVWVYQIAAERKHWGWYLLTGTTVAAAALCKYSALVLVPLFLVLDLAQYLSIQKKKAKDMGLFIYLNRWAWGTLGFGLCVFLVFLPATFRLNGHYNPFYFFWNALHEIILHGKHPWPSYFMGHLSTQRYWYYFPVAFLLKSTLPLSILLFLGIGLVLAKRIQIPAWQWLPPLAILLSLLGVIDIGIRYLLPAFPFIILLGAQGLTWLWQNKFRAHGRSFKMIAIGLLAWQATSTLANFPHHISYFNDLVSSDRKRYWLGDSNLDFDQDLKRLAKTAAYRHWGKVKLAYSGGTPPQIYGLDWRRWTQKDLQGPQPGNIYVVNVGFLQIVPAFFPETIPISNGWISKLTPTGQVADTWYYFEVSGTPTKDDSSELPSVPVLKN